MDFSVHLATLFPASIHVHLTVIFGSTKINNWSALIKPNTYIPSFSINNSSFWYQNHLKWSRHSWDTSKTRFNLEFCDKEFPTYWHFLVECHKFQRNSGLILLGLKGGFVAILNEYFENGERTGDLFKRFENIARSFQENFEGTSILNKFRVQRNFCLGI